MSLYPTLEDLKVDGLVQTQAQHEQAAAAIASSGGSYEGAVQTSYPSLYPALQEYMGLDLSQKVGIAMEQSGAGTVAVGSGWSHGGSSGGQLMVAPVTGNDLGIKRSEIKQGLRNMVLCKDGKGKIGVVVQGVNKGVFVAFVYKDSPAALAGLRFGDQILEVNGQTVAGWSTDKAMEFLKKCSPERITFIVRDRPFERTITMNKDSNGYIGFVFKKGKITALVKDSSAARNGLLIDHQLIEVNGQNVVGLKDTQIQSIIDGGPRAITVTIMPSFIYEHIMKCIGSGLIKKHMDHSVPEV